MVQAQQKLKFPPGKFLKGLRKGFDVRVAGISGNHLAAIPCATSAETNWQLQDHTNTQAHLNTALILKLQL